MAAKPVFPESWFRPEMPGYGTFPWPFQNTGAGSTEGSREAIRAALEAGYRHIDTAFTYRNQDQIGNALRDTGIPRLDVFVTSKLHQNNNFYHDAKTKIREAIETIWGRYSIESGGYLDAFLLHYPGVGKPLEAWRALQEARYNGFVRHIGVSNFEIWHLEKLHEGSGEFPEINQIEFHPWIYPEEVELVEFCKSKWIAVEGYSPFAQGQGLNDPIVRKISEHHKTTPARVLLKWCMQHGVKPIFGSRNPIHLVSNAASYCFLLSDEEMKSLDALGEKNLVRVSKRWNWNPKTANFGGPLPGQRGDSSQ